MFLVCAASAAVLWGMIQDKERPAQESAPILTTTGSSGAADVSVAADFLEQAELDPQARARLIQKPLFSETRSPRLYQPPPPIEEVAQPEPMPETELPETDPLASQPLTIPGIALLGIIAEEGVSRVLIRLSDQNQERWFDIGDDIDGWSITEISRSAITLSQNGYETIVSLYQ